MSKLDTTKPSIFDLLDQMQCKNRAYYRSLPDDQKAAFHPFVVMKWLAGTPSDDQLLLINDVVNPKVFALAHTDKDLVMDLLSACTSGRKSRFRWVKRPQSSPSKIDEVFIQVYGPSVDLEHARATHSTEDIELLCQSLGMQEQETQALLKLVRS